MQSKGTNNMETIKYCTKCKRRGHLVSSELLPLLKKAYPDAEFEDKCLSFCGPGSKKPFVQINGALVFAETNEELMEQIAEVLDMD